jgi:hypothetical protein
VLTSVASVVPLAAGAVNLEFDTREGRSRRSLDLCATFRFELDGSPVRNFPSFRGQHNFPGLWWFATTGAHVGHESWVERDQLMALDADPDVVGVLSQPFWFHWPDGTRHAPDHFVRRLLIRPTSEFQIIPGKVRLFMSPRRDPSTSFDHCSGRPDGLAQPARLRREAVLDLRSQ